MTGRPEDPVAEDHFDAHAFQSETGVSRETLERLSALIDFLKKWQRKINLIGPGTLPDIWRRHVFDSAQLLPLIEDYARRRRLAEQGQPLVLVDLGSGAGFPGLVLAIMADGAGLPLDVHLIESNGRKCVYLQEAARHVGVEISVHGDRVEQMEPFPAHIITARACAPLDRLLGYAEGFWGPSTEALFLKGQHIEKERVQATISWGMVAKTVPSRSDPAGAVLWVTELRKGGA